MMYHEGHMNATSALNVVLGVRNTFMAFRYENSAN